MYDLKEQCWAYVVDEKLKNYPIDFSKYYTKIDLSKTELNRDVNGNKIGSAPVANASVNSYGLPYDPNAKINTESPAWAIDRLSILHLKIYHMNIEATRDNISEDQRTKCKEKLQVLLAQLEAMTVSISQLLEDYASGERIMKMYKQMKMYNDPSLNPVLYKK